eukprot:5747197-Prorocentrum_lima.AAC.1
MTSSLVGSEMCIRDSISACEKSAEWENFYNAAISACVKDASLLRLAFRLSRHGLLHSCDSCRSELFSVSLLLGAAPHHLTSRHRCLTRKEEGGGGGVGRGTL